MRSLSNVLALALLASAALAAPVDHSELMIPTKASKRASNLQPLMPRQSSPPDPSNFPCANGGVMVLIARGSDLNHPTPTVVDPQYGVLSKPLQQIVNAAKKAGGHDSFITAVPYPASTAGYAVSLQRGIITAKDMVMNYVNQCGPDSKIVLVGYSQGAQIMSSVLVGGDNETGIDSEGLSGNIVAGVLIADPSRIYPVPIDVGTGHHYGRVPIRYKTPEQEANLSNEYYGRLQSYCQSGDMFCAAGNGTNAHHIHLKAPARFRKDAIAFLVPLIQNATAYS